MPPTKKSLVKPTQNNKGIDGNIAIAVISVLIIIGFLYAAKGMLTAFVVGLILAYILSPVQEHWAKYGFSRTASSLVLVILSYIVLVGLFAGLIPFLVYELLKLATEQQHIWQAVQDIPAHIQNIFGISMALPSIVEVMSQHGSSLLQGSSKALQNILSGVSAVSDTLMLLFITPLVTFYVLQTWPTLLGTLESLIPPTNRKPTLQLLNRINSKLSGFLHGQMLVAVCQGLIYGIGLFAIGVPYGFGVGLFAGLLSFIPMLGGPMGFVLAMLVTLAEYQLQSWVPYALVAAVFAFGSVVEQFYLSPKLLGKGVGLHPIWVLFALLAGAQIAGFVGVVLAVPVAAIVSELLPLVVKTWQNSNLFKGPSA